jgi:hypothetical protein
MVRGQRVYALALGIGGLAPGALYASALQAAPSPSAVPADWIAAAGEQSRPVRWPDRGGRVGRALGLASGVGGRGASGCAWPCDRAGHPRRYRLAQTAPSLRRTSWLHRRGFDST